MVTEQFFIAIALKIFILKFGKTKLYTMEVDKEFKPWGMEEKQFITLMHIAQFAGVIIPYAGLALPIIMWVMNKEESEAIDLHGKKITNWIISLTIYGAISGILTFILIGLIPLFILAALGVIYPIIGAIQANDGKLFGYPLSISLIK